MQEAEIIVPQPEPEDLSGAEGDAAAIRQRQEYAQQQYTAPQQSYTPAYTAPQQTYTAPSAPRYTAPAAPQQSAPQTTTPSKPNTGSGSGPISGGHGCNEGDCSDAPDLGYIPR